MTNKEKFIEVFGIEPDEHFCPISDNVTCKKCPYSDNGCDDIHPANFFNLEYEILKGESEE